MIDKIQPRKLDKDSDLRLVQKNSMVDALNVYVDESNTADADGQGSAGLLKPIKGTTKLSFSVEEEEPIVYDTEGDEVLDSKWRVLGGVVDDATGVYYFFAWNDTDPTLQGVYAYDPDNVLPGADEGGLRRIFTTDLFNFPPNGFVKGSVVYTRPKNRPSDSKLPDNDVILYFTDNLNEPRKLNVYRCLHSEEPSGYNDYNKNDFICACPKVPMGNVSFEFVADTSKQVSNFENTPGFQFAIQGVYYDGSVTAIGPYSDLAIPPSITNRGAASKSNILSHNLCRITIPELTSEVEKIKILARTGNSANFVEIDEVKNVGGDNSNWVNAGSNRYYKFYNDRVSLGVSPTEVSKTFDSVPRRAQAQTAASNRLVYGNFKEGYDPHRPQVTTEVLFKKRPSEGVDFTIDLIPSVEQNQRHGTYDVTYYNKCMGFEIDVSQIPDEIPAETSVTVSFSFAPRKNFHVFQSRYSYNQSRHVGPISGDYRGFKASNAQGGGAGADVDINPDGAPYSYDIPQASPAGQMLSNGYGTPGWMGPYNAGGGFVYSENSEEYLYWGYLSDQTKTSCNALFGQNYGVAFKAPISHGSGLGWGSDAGQQDPPRWFSTGTANAITCAYGSSAGAPLILQGGSVEFSCSFTINEDISNGKVVVSRSLREILCKKKQENLTYSSVVTINESPSTYTHSIDLGLSDGNKIYDSDSNSDLITAISNVGASGGVTTDRYKITQVSMEGDTQGRLPAGYIIVNKAEVDFYLEESKYREGDNNFKEGVYLAIADVRLTDEEKGLFTCFKRPEPQTPWVCFSNETMKEAVEVETVDNLVSSYVDSLPEKDVYLNFEGVRFNVERLESFDSPPVMVNKYALGYFKMNDLGDGNGFDFWPCKVDVDSEDYVPDAHFRFSLLDGEAGPGGEGPGIDSAFSRFKNGKRGSIGGQCRAVFYGNHGEGANTLTGLRDALVRALPHVGISWDEFSVNESFRGEGTEVSAAITEAVWFGQLKNDPNLRVGQNEAAGYTTKPGPRTNGSKIPNRREAYDPGNETIYDTVCDVIYVANGPFYTGSIAMNPLVTNGENVITNFGADFPDLMGDYDGNTLSTYEFLNGALSPDGINSSIEWIPPLYDQTTTLPYIFSGSTRKAVRDMQITFADTFPIPILDPDNLIPPSGTAPIYSAYQQEDSGLFPDLYNLGDMAGYNSNHPSFNGISFRGKLPHPEMGSVGTSVTGATGKPIMTFKSNANHEFGVVYYDERGRHGAVNPVASVYVPGLAPSERNGIADGGPVHIRMSFQSPPPDWAKYYKIAYSKNTSISDFFQYSAGGAYVIPSENQIDPNLDSAKIYISLNYLQGHPISYSDSWGARSQEGSPVVFQPKEGDKVRVLSYQRPTGNSLEKIYPRDIVFDVAGIESLGGDNNPIATEEETLADSVPEYKKGLFLTVKNNPANEDFSYSNILTGNDYWGNNCIIEIYRPIKDLEAEKRLFYEIGPTYMVKEGTSGVKYHANHANQYGPIEITQGDVYFRKTAVNMREFEGGEFVDILGYTDVEIDPDTNEVTEVWVSNSEPNFKSIYTEAMSASDLFKSDALSIGRPNKIDSNEMEYDRVASLIHSDRDIAKDSKLGYSSFNRSTVIDRDMDVVHGEVRYIENTDDSIMVIQRDKVGHIPVDRNLISTADNEPSLIASSKFLGTARYYAGKAGCDSNPESVVVIDGTAYFAHKKDGKVFRASGANGVMDISAKGMKTFFRDLFRNAGQYARIIGGFDPKKDEYLLTITQPSLQSPNGETEVSVPDVEIPSVFLPNSSQTDTALASTAGGGYSGQDTPQDDGDTNTTEFGQG
jgi:hypothetical protein